LTLPFCARSTAEKGSVAPSKNGAATRARAPAAMSYTIATSSVCSSNVTSGDTAAWK
jgi:hypothetical protein